MERRHALDTARNILYSKVGKVVLDDNKFPDRKLELEVRRIDVETKKNSSLIENDKKMFKRERLIYNLQPTLLIERPPSPSTKALEQTEGDGSLQHYMMPIKKSEKSNNAAKMLLPTIDAFTVLKRKTKNIWETEHTDEDMNNKFRSIIMQSPPLNGPELTKLDKEYATFRPASRKEEEAQRRTQEKKQEKIALLRQVQRAPSTDLQLTFITQLDQEAQNRAASKTKDMQSPNNGFAELNFNPIHLERFEKIREKQRQKFFKKIKDNN